MGFKRFLYWSLATVGLNWKRREFDSHFKIQKKLRKMQHAIAKTSELPARNLCLILYLFQFVSLIVVCGFLTCKMNILLLALCTLRGCQENQKEKVYVKWSWRFDDAFLATKRHFSNLTSSWILRHLNNQISGKGIWLGCQRYTLIFVFHCFFYNSLVLVHLQRCS